MDYCNTAVQTAKFDKYVVSTRVRAGRSIRGLPLPPVSLKSSSLVRGADSDYYSIAHKMTGELKGTYYPLGGMTPAQEQQMIDDHFLFQKPSPRNVLANCGAGRDWPDARGIFHNDAKNFLVWVNEECVYCSGAVTVAVAVNVATSALAVS
eukprot:6317-Heterococcus_DN1.PRE.2